MSSKQTRPDGHSARGEYVSSQNGKPPIRPFLRWPGGKRESAASIAAWVPPGIRTYIEPFAGSAALFFELQPKAAQLGDANGELMNAFKVVRDQVEQLIGALSNMSQSTHAYYRVRQTVPADDVGRAARFIYLNRTAFNGIWRVNRQGRFNVPYGHRPRRDLVDAEGLRRASGALGHVHLITGDFAVILKGARKGDLVYADPPYTVKHDNNGFRRYNEVLFSWTDQVRLAELLTVLAKRGVHVLVTNAHSGEVRALYEEHFVEHKLSRVSRLAANPSNRGLVREALFMSESLTGRRNRRSQRG